MDIILLSNIEKVGKKFEVVTVKNGYGRNFLIPQGLAIVANQANRRNLDSFKRVENAKLNKRLDEFKAIAAKLSGVVLKMTAKAGTSGRIFGSVTSMQIAEALKAQFDIDVDKRSVVLEEPIKTLGSHTASLDLHPNVDAKVSIEVSAHGEASEEEPGEE